MAKAQHIPPQFPQVGSIDHCPRCGAGPDKFNRWPQNTEVWRVACSACNFGWQETSAYSAVDAANDAKGTVIAMLAVALSAIGVLFFVYVVFLLLKDLHGIGEPSPWLLGGILLLAFASMLVIASKTTNNPGPEL
jgi:uncharacterized protein (DUF983 family)